MTKTSTKKHAQYKHHNNDHHLQEDMEKIRKLILNAATHAGDKASEMVAQSYDDLKDKSVHVQDNLRKYAANKPFKSLGSALLIGLALGYLLNKKKNQ